MSSCLAVYACVRPPTAFRIYFCTCVCVCVCVFTQEMISPWSKLAPDYVLNVLIELIQTESADCMLASLAIVHDMLAVAPPAAASLLYGPDAPAPTPSMAARLKAARLSDGETPMTHTHTTHNTHTHTHTLLYALWRP